MSMDHDKATRQTADRLKQMLMDPVRHPIRFGVVIDRDLDAGLVKVNVMPEEDPTDFIRYVGMGITLGKWRGLYLPPLDTEVMLVAVDPECSTYIATGGLYNGVDTPPTGYEDGEILWAHEDGNRFVMGSDGILYLGGKQSAESVIMKTFIDDHFNPLVNKVNTLGADVMTHTHITTAPGAPTGPASASVPPFVYTPVSPWVSGNISTRFKGL